MLTLEKSVGAVVFRKDGNKIKYLLLHYRSRHWDFPKGHVEKEETEEDTLRREVAEETGIKSLKILSGFTQSTGYFYAAKGEEKKRRISEQRRTKIKKQVVYYLAETPEEAIKISSEHINFRWLSFPEAFKKITYKNSRNILVSANEFVNRKTL